MKDSCLVMDVILIAFILFSPDEPETTSKLNKPARYLVREAFYSSKSQQSRNFAKAVEQSQKSDGFPVSEISYGNKTLYPPWPFIPLEMRLADGIAFLCLREATNVFHWNAVHLYTCICSQICP